MKKLSAAGANFIGSFEGFRSRCYDDATGNCTIGFGHLVHYGKTKPADREKWDPITRERGLALLKQDAGLVEAEINRVIKIALTQAQYDALVSFGYNCGTGAVSSVAKVVNAKPLGKLRAWKRPAWRRRVYTELTMWCHGNGGVVLQGLLRRRIAEATLFTTGRYTRVQGNKSANA